MKTVVLDVIDLRGDHHTAPLKAFKVKTMQNTIKFRIGEYLSEDQVQDCISMGWTVNVKPYK